MQKTDDLFRHYAALRAALGSPLIPNREYDYENKIIIEENAKAGVTPKQRRRIRIGEPDDVSIPTRGTEKR